MTESVIMLDEIHNNLSWISIQDMNMQQEECVISEEIAQFLSEVKKKKKDIYCHFAFVNVKHLLPVLIHIIQL